MKKKPVLGLDDIDALRYERFAWCKAYRPDELREASRPGSQARLRIEQVLAEATSIGILGKVVDHLLEMKESSNYDRLRRGPWSSVTQARGWELISSYQDRWGCPNSAQAAEWIKTLDGDWFELTDSRADAVAVVSPRVCAFFFDGG